MFDHPLPPHARKQKPSHHQRSLTFHHEDEGRPRIVARVSPVLPLAQLQRLALASEFVISKRRGATGDLSAKSWKSSLVPRHRWPSNCFNAWTYSARARRPV